MVLSPFFLFVNAQQADKIINAAEAERIEKILSADDMQGRKTFTPGIDKAADFIAAEFAKSKLKYFANAKNYFQEISMIKVKPLEVTESKWGTNSAYITGYEKSDFGKILQKNLEGTGFHFEPDPYPKENLFYRSDNATLAALGVPAHTISTSKMDSEKFYHTQEDEIETLDMKNMAEIIKAIAISSSTIVSGKDTPARVEKAK